MKIQKGEVDKWMRSDIYETFKSKLQDQNTGIISSSIAKGIGQKRFGYFLTALALLG